MPAVGVNQELAEIFDRLALSKAEGGDGKAGDYPSADPERVAAAFPTAALAQQLIDLTAGTEPGTVGQVRGVRLQYEHACALARSEAVRRSTRVRVFAFAAAARRAAGKGLRLPTEAAQTLLKAGS